MGQGAQETADAPETAEGIVFFRNKDALTLAEAGCEIHVPSTEVQQTGLEKMFEAGYGDGYEIKVLINNPDFSLIYLWFKQNFPLPLHSHDVDCMYYIIAGSLRFGTENLVEGDSFFIPANVPYTYRAGANGVEALEIRGANRFEFRNFAKSKAYYDRAVGTIIENRSAWQSASRPTRAG